jgi:hypothetical protein
LLLDGHEAELLAKLHARISSVDRRHLSGDPQAIGIHTAGIHTGVIHMPPSPPSARPHPPPGHPQVPRHLSAGLVVNVVSTIRAGIHKVSSTSIRVSGYAQLQHPQA